MPATRWKKPPWPICSNSRATPIHKACLRLYPYWGRRPSTANLKNLRKSAGRFRRCASLSSAVRLPTAVILFTTAVVVNAPHRARWGTTMLWRAISWNQTMVDTVQNPPPVLRVQNLKTHYVRGSSFLGGKTQTVYALDGVTFSVAERETLSIVGESGCGKSTLGKVVMGLTPATEGQVHVNGRRIDNLSVRQLRPLRREMQMVFQDPFSSLNPRMRVEDIIAEPLVNFGLAKTKAEVKERVAALLDQVRLP